MTCSVHLTHSRCHFQVVGYRGRAVVVVSCVTSEQPYRPHPHSLVGKEGCKKGVCTLEIPTDTMTISFPSLGVQCVKKKEIEEALNLRQEIRVDPFQSKIFFLNFSDYPELFLKFYFQPVSRTKTILNSST